MCSVRFSKQTFIIFLDSINRSVNIMAMTLFSARLETEFLETDARH